MAAIYGEDWIERTHRYAVRVLKVANKLPRTPVGFHLAGQVARSAPSIPFNLEEAKAALTEPDTLNKTGIARKESVETRRALLVIRDVELLPAVEHPEVASLIVEGTEIVAMLTSGTKRLQARIAARARSSRPRTEGF